MPFENSQSLTQIENELQRYFDKSLQPIMDNVREELDRKQAQEIVNHQTSVGAMSQFSSAMFVNPMLSLRHTGKWTSKTAEDYVMMCQEKIVSNKTNCDEILKLTNKWKEAVISEIGTKNYDELSRKMNCDLSLAYLDYRIDQMMINYMVKKEMPKSSIEYILTKGGSNSIVGMMTSVPKSTLEQEIARRSEKTYNPSAVEKFASWTFGIGADVVSMGGVSSFSALAKLIGVEVVFSGVEKYLGRENNQSTLTVDQLINQELSKCRANYIETKKEINRISNQEKLQLESQSKTDMEETNVISDQTDKHITSDINNNSENAKDSQNKQPTILNEEKVEDKSVDSQTESNNDGWSELINNLGFNDVGDVFRNLPYVLATLPDKLFGLLNGKTELKFGTAIGIASVVMGLITKNPFLKMLLIGMGGSGLVYKLGAESIQKNNTQQYKLYDNEKLNPRISNPMVQGNILVAEIDDVPCSVTITENAAKAYSAGALPLNTLANAVLVKYDQSNTTASTRIDITSTIDRDRGIILR
jgi:hypothetical protein